MEDDEDIRLEWVGPTTYNLTLDGEVLQSFEFRSNTEEAGILHPIHMALMSITNIQEHCPCPRKNLALTMLLDVLIQTLNSHDHEVYGRVITALITQLPDILSNFDIEEITVSDGELVDVLKDIIGQGDDDDDEPSGSIH